MSSSRRRSRITAWVATTALALSGLTVGAATSASAALDGPPTSLAPNSTTSLHKDVELTWTASAGATSYDIQVLDDVDPDVATILAGTSTIARWTVPVALPGGEYRWRVRAHVAGRTGSWSAMATLERGWESAPRTREAVSASPVPVLSWAPLPDASLYEVEINRTSFSSGEYRPQDSFVCRTVHTTIAPYGVALGGSQFADPPGSEASCAFGAGSAGLDRAGVYLLGQTYFWRVRGRDGTIDTARTPFVTSPGACVAPWVNSGITVAPDSTYGSVVTVPIATRAPTAAANPECSPWSTQKQVVPRIGALGLVRTAPTGLALAPLAPGSTSRLTASPTFSWSPTPGAAKYRLYFSRDRQINSVDLAAETFATTLTPYTNLTLGSTTRYWAVQACGLGRDSVGDNACGPVSSPRPVSQSTASPATAISLTRHGNYLLATWSTGLALRGPARSYDVRLTDTETGKATVFHTDRLAMNLDGGTSSLAVPSPGGSAVFEVRAVDQSGRASSWSRPSTTTVRLVSAAGFADRAPVDLRFNAPVSAQAAGRLALVDASGNPVTGTLTQLTSTDYRFRPALPWVTGVALRIRTVGVQDERGAKVAAVGAPTRAGTTAASTGAGLVFAAGDRPWTVRTSSDATGGSYRVATDDPRTGRHASASVSIYGSAFTVGVCKSPRSGAIAVFVDGRLRSSTSLYRVWTGCANRLEVTGLSRGQHRVTIVTVGAAGRPDVGLDDVSVR